MAAAGCGYARTRLAESLMADVAAATAKHDDVTLVSQAVPPFLLLLEGMIEGDPGNPGLRTEAARGYTSYGVLVEAEDPERARRVYSRAMDHGRRALMRNDRAAALLKAPLQGFHGDHGNPGKKGSRDCFLDGERLGSVDQPEHRIDGGTRRPPARHTADGMGAGTGRDPTRTAAPTSFWASTTLPCHRCWAASRKRPGSISSVQWN